MDIALRAVLKYLWKKKYFGHKHTPEERTIKKVVHWRNREQKKEFNSQYKEVINEGLILRLKKRTGKGSDWHISINPKKIKDLMEKLNQD